MNIDIEVSPGGRKVPRRVCRGVALGLGFLLVVAPVLALGASWEDPPAEPAAQPVSEAVPAKPPAPPVAAQVPADPGPRTEGLIPGVLLGPKVTATLLFPPNVMVGLELRVIGYIGASFEYGVFPQNQDVGGYNLKIKTWSTGLRCYPWRGAFFIGAVLGNYDLTAAQAVNGTQFATLQVKSMYLGPQIGWKWAWDFGLFLGLNLGYGFSLDYQSTLTQPPLAPSSDLKTAKENADKYLKPGVPILTLLELGFLF
jgi:hypothetical protein